MSTRYILSKNDARAVKETLQAALKEDMPYGILIAVGCLSSTYPSTSPYPACQGLFLKDNAFAAEQSCNDLLVLFAEGKRLGERPEREAAAIAWLEDVIADLDRIIDGELDRIIDGQNQS